MTLIKEITKVSEVVSGAMDHGRLLGLADDDHVQYLLLAGRAGGQVAYGGTGNSEALTLRSTSGVVKGYVYVGPSEEFRVDNWVHIRSSDEQPLLKISNISVTAFDPVIKFGLGAAAETMFTMGVDDSDSDKWKISNDDVLGPTGGGWTFGDLLVFGDGYNVSHVRAIGVNVGDLDTISKSSANPAYTPAGVLNKVYVDDDGTVYITDNDYGVAKFDSDLNFIQLYTHSWFTGASAVYGICKWGNYFYVSAYGVGTTYDGVFQFDTSFTNPPARYLGSADSGDPDYLSTPRGVCTDGSFFYVANTSVGLYVFTQAGSYVTRITSSGGKSLTDIWGCQTDGTYIYVADRVNDRVCVLSCVDLSYVGECSTSGTNYTIWDVAINGSYVYAVIFEDIVDMIRIMKFRKETWALEESVNVTPGPPNPYTSSRGVGIRKTYSESKDLLVLHHDSSYFEVYPVTRFMDDIRLHETNLTTSDYVGLAAPAAVTASYTLALPVAAPGATKHLYSDSANQLAWGQDVTPTGSPSFVRLTLTQAIGTAPLTITSTTLVTNLNADLLDGLQATAFILGDGVPKITVGTVEPTSPQTGDLWLDIS